MRLRTRMTCSDIAPSVRLLIQRGCSVNQVDSAGCSALQRAAHLGRADMVQLLLQHRANANSVDAARQTALHAAAERGLEGGWERGQVGW